MKEARINFNDGKKEVYAKIKDYRFEGIRFVLGKGYYIDKEIGGKWTVFETDIDFDHTTNSLRTGNSWEVFKTKNREKAIEVAKFLAERVEVE